MCMGETKNSFLLLRPLFLLKLLVMMQDYCFIDCFTSYPKVDWFLLNQHTAENISVFFFQQSLTFLHFSFSFVTPTSFVFGDEDVTSVECYTETFNYTYKASVSGCFSLCGSIPQVHPPAVISPHVCLQVLNSGPSRSRDTVVEIMLPKILPPYRHRLLQLVDWQVGCVLCCIHQLHTGGSSSLTEAAALLS